MGRAERKRPVVLIVEDEPLVLMDAVDIVTNAGFEALEAESADKAIDILESRNDVSVVFTDVAMPGSMDGLKLAQAVRDRWPPVQLIIVSAFHRKTEAIPAGGRFFAKPYHAADITRALQELTN